jgi:hypothetical protein
MFVRVRDKDTGHEYDVWESSLDPQAHKVIEGYPQSRTARPAKHRTTKAGKPAIPSGRLAHSSEKE